MIEVNKINVFYGGLQVLYDVYFNVDEGEVVSIVGSNGAGKTTILKTISGITTIKSGTINFLGNRIDNLPPSKIVDAGVVHVPEGRRLFHYMSVRENLEIGAITRRAKEKKYESLGWIYGLFPILKERKNQLAGTLSGGEQQMLAIGRGLMAKPKLLMLDEPSLGLAPKLVLKTLEVVKEINRQGVTILLVEQNTQYALELATRAYVLETGRITLEGTGRELLGNEHVKKAYLGL
jgi:branched-chain amino acid transport system ATP-binding protein